MNILDTIKLLCGIPGVSGLEAPVREAIIELIEGHCKEWRVDALGNLLVFKEGRKRPKRPMLLDAHMDEVGFIVTHIETDGTLRFAAVGGLDPRVVMGRAVEVGPDRLYGVIGAKAMHHASAKERETPIPLDKLRIDIGAADEAQASEHVAVGDRAIFHAEPFEFGDGLLCARALDDRAGCALLVELIRSELEYDCHFSFTVLEETGCTGAVTAARAVGAELALVVETTTAADIAGVEPGNQVCRLGEGAAISFMDRGAVYDHALYRRVLEAAREKNIPCQPKAAVAGGNNGRSVQVAGDGVRTVAVSLPCRYIHSATNVIKLDDLHATLDLLKTLNAALGEWEG